MSEPVANLAHDDLDSVSEAQLLAAIIHLLPELLGTRSSPTVVAREVKVSRSIADAVLVQPRKRPKRIPEPLSISDSVILSALRRSGPTRVDILEKRCGAHAGELRGAILDRLQQQGFVRRSHGGRVSGLTWASDLRVVAIEAKLAKWRQALVQASSYRRYADFSYVVLPSVVAESPRLDRAEFRGQGVGLISARVSGELAILVPSVRQKEHDWQREFVCSRLLCQV